MGSLIYAESGIEIQFEDRVLAHLQLVIGAKLRRRESFFFSWKDDPKVGDGRSAVWVDPAIPLYFKYSGSKAPLVNRDWLDVLTTSANSPQGLHLVAEPDAGSGHNGSPQSMDNSVKP